PLHTLGTVSLPPRLQRNGATMPAAVRIAAQLAAPVSWFTATQGDAELYVAAIPRSDEMGYIAVAPGPPDINFAEGPATELVVRRPDVPDTRLDNETPDIHSDGVQLYVGGEDWQGFVLVPDLDSDKVYVRPVVGTSADPRRLTATWARTGTGYRMVASFDIGRPMRRGDQFLVNTVINRMHSGRERRAGQLVLSGDAGWVYLRGD